MQGVQCAGGQSRRRAEQTAWWSQDGVRWWRRLSNSEMKPRGMVTNRGDEGGKCRQTQGGLRYASPLRPAKYLSQTFDAVQMPVPFSYGNIVSYLKCTLRLGQILFVCFFSFFFFASCAVYCFDILVFWN